jgi:hypothetical protein
VLKVQPDHKVPKEVHLVLSRLFSDTSPQDLQVAAKFL